MLVFELCPVNAFASPDPKQEASAERWLLRERRQGERPIYSEACSGTNARDGDVKRPFVAAEVGNGRPQVLSLRCVGGDGKARGELELLAERMALLAFSIASGSAAPGRSPLNILEIS